jgi:hypothetical protein
VGGGLAHVSNAVGLAAFNPLCSGVGAFVVLLIIHVWQWTRSRPSSPSPPSASSGQNC